MDVILLHYLFKRSELKRHEQMVHNSTILFLYFGMWCVLLFYFQVLILVL